MERLPSTRWKKNVDMGMRLGRAIIEHCLDMIYNHVTITISKARRRESLTKKTRYDCLYHL